MEPVGQWPAYAASYNRLSSAAAGGDSHLSTVSGNSSTLPHGRAATPSTTAPSPQLLCSVQAAPPITPFAPAVLLPSTTLASYNSVVFNQQRTYQPNLTFNTSRSHYQQSVVTAGSNPYYEDDRNAVLMSHPSVDSIPPQLGSELQNAYGHIGPVTAATPGSLLSKSNSANYDNFSNNLFDTTSLDSQSINFNYNDNSNSQQCGVSMNYPKDNNLYPNISHPYGALNSLVNNNPYNVHRTSKKSVIVTPASLSPSSLSPLSMSTVLPASVKVNDQLHDHVQHQRDRKMSLNCMNTKQLHPASSPARSHHPFDIHSRSFPNSLPQPITEINSKEFQSTELTSKVQSSLNVPLSQPTNNIYDQSSKTPAHGIHQHAMINKNQHHVYNNSLSESSSPSSPLTYSIGGPPTHSSSTEVPQSDLTALDQQSSFEAAFDKQTSPSLAPGYQMPFYKEAKYASSPQQDFHKGRSENMGAFSPCSRQEQGPVMCAVTSPLNTQFQSSPSYPSHNSPVTLSSASQPPSKLNNLLDNSVLLGGFGDNLKKASQLSSSQANNSETNFNGLTHVNQQSYWQDSNHNLHKADFNYSERNLSTNSANCFDITSVKRSATDDSCSYLHPKLNEAMSPANSNPISSTKKVSSDIQEKVNYLPTDVMAFNRPQPKDQRRSKQSQSDLQTKNSVEQKVSNNGSNPFQRSSTGKMSSYDDTNQIRFNNNAASNFQSPTDYASTALPLPNVSLSQNIKSSNLNQISQENSLQPTITFGDSNSYYNSSLLNESNTISRNNDTSVVKNASSLSPLKMHLPIDSTPEQQKKNVSNALNNDAKHVTEEICSNATPKPTPENYAFDSMQKLMLNDNCTKSSVNGNLSGIRASSTMESSINTIPFHNVDQSLVVSQSPSSNQTPPNDVIALQTYSVNNSQTPSVKLSSISIPTENSSYCISTSGEKRVKKRIVVPSVEEELNFLFGPVGTHPVVNHNQKQKSTRRGRPPKKKDCQVAKMPEKKPLSFPPAVNNGFMASYIKFLEGIQYDSPENVVPPPRREQSTRKAKQKNTIKRLLDDECEDADDYNSFNSDSDPAWSPAAVKDDSDEDFDIGRRTRSRSFRGSGQRGRKRGRPSNASDMSSDDNEERRASKQRKYSTRTKSLSQADDKSNDSDVIFTNSSEVTIASNSFPFHVGEFVINKTEVNLENPPIWRVDGKTLLQKYEVSELKGETVYKSIPTYAGWTHLNNDAFQRVQVKIKMQNRNDIIVQLLAKETKVPEEEQNVVDKFMEEAVKYQDHFEIYIQTLISQALDSNFLAEIIQENDEYFLESVKTIDEITLERKQKLKDSVNWQDSVVEKSMATWPCIDVLHGDPNTDVGGEKCASCKTEPVTKRVIAFGQPYNNENLEGCPPDPAVSEHKDFLLCKKCIQAVTLYNKIVHQKYLMFSECANKVQERKTSDPTKDTTVVLNELLADEQWLSQLFKDVRSNWAGVETFVTKSQNVEANNELPN